MRNETGDARYFAPLERSGTTVWDAIKKSCTVPFRKQLAVLSKPLLCTVYLCTSRRDTLSRANGTSARHLVRARPRCALPHLPSLPNHLRSSTWLERTVHRFELPRSRGRNGMRLSVAALLDRVSGFFMTRRRLTRTPSLHRRKIAEYKVKGEHPPPETRLYIGMVGAILFPAGMSRLGILTGTTAHAALSGLFWLAFTTYKSVHPLVPIFASIPVGMGTIYIFTTSFTFLVTAYRCVLPASSSDLVETHCKRDDIRPYAASAMAGNSFVRSAFAAVFPLFAGPMYRYVLCSGSSGF